VATIRGVQRGPKGARQLWPNGIAVPHGEACFLETIEVATKLVDMGCSPEHMIRGNNRQMTLYHLFVAEKISVRVAQGQPIATKTIKSPCIFLPRIPMYNHTGNRCQRLCSGRGQRWKSPVERDPTIVFSLASIPHLASGWSKMVHLHE